MFLKAKKFRTACAALIVLFAAQTAYAQDKPKPNGVTISVVAVQATKENNRPKHFDREILPFRKSLAKLSYDTFRKLKIVGKSAPFGKTVKIPINEQYTLYLTPIERQKDGRVRVKARITMKRKPNGKTLDALKTTLSLPQGKPLNLGGMKLEKGHLIIVLSVKDSTLASSRERPPP